MDNKIKIRILSIICFCILSFCGCNNKKTNENEITSSLTKIQKPEWLKGPVVMKGSNQEPLIFQLRRGSVTTRTEANYLRSHTIENVKDIKDFGGTFFMSHVFKGFGIEAERPEIELAKKLAPLLHENNIKMGTYVGSSIAYETFLLEKPKAEEWLVPDYLGQPVTYGNQFFRRRPYFGHPEYREYIKQVLNIAINEIVSDLIHFDNPANQAVPAVFHHPLAIQDFREFLKSKYTPAKLKERIGFADVSRVIPPAYPNPGSFQSFDDPVTQEWIDFRCQKLADYYKEMSAYIRNLNSEVAVEFNPHGITGTNRAWESSVDFARLLPHTDVFWCEDGNPASISSDGILISNIRSYKIGRIFNNLVFNGIGGSVLMIAETMSYNPHSITSPSNALKHYVTFYHKNFQYYGNAKNIADVAILRSFPSMAYSNYNTHQSTILYEQVLIQCKIPFDIIYDEHLKDLSKYSVLILANQESLRDDQLEIIRKFVYNGGGLVATENSSLFDEWRREREGFGLKDLFGIEKPLSIKNIRMQDGGALESLEEFETRQAGKTIKSQFGQGRVVYIPLIEPSINRPATSSMTNRYWKLPSNFLEMEESVKWAAGKEMSIEIKAPLTVTMELTEQENRRIIHLINFNIEKEKLVKNINVSLKIPEGRKIKEILLLSPDREAIDSLPYLFENDRANFQVPILEIYNMIVIKF